MIVYILGAIISYLIGSFNTAFVVSSIKKKNLRSGGSGNFGASNTAILLGFKWGVFVALVDILKGFLVVFIAKMFFADYWLLPFVVSSGAILGHIFPFYLKFKGGKGFATLVGCILGYNWIVALIAAVAIAIITISTDYIVIATLSTIVGYSIYIGIVTHSVYPVLILWISFICIFIKHIPNIIRIAKKEEIGFRSSFDKKHKI